MANLYATRGIRLDHYVVDHKPLLSRAFAVRLINEGKVLVSGNQEKPGYKLRIDDVVTIDFDDSSLDVIPDIDLPVLYEDDNVMVIDKPSGVISHARGRYWDEASVASFVRSRVTNGQEWSEETGLPTRTGIVHRLDRATSGVMICAKNPETLKFLQKQFGDRTVRKTYCAIISGHLEPKEAVIDMPIERNPKLPSTFRVGPNGKPSVTSYQVLKSSEKYDLVELTPKTGRTHQLRVHLKKMAHPIVGDVLYGGEVAERLCLHAASLTIVLPDGQEKTFTAPLPAIFDQYIR